MIVIFNLYQRFCMYIFSISVGFFLARRLLVSDQTALVAVLLCAVFTRIALHFRVTYHVTLQMVLPFATEGAHSAVEETVSGVSHLVGNEGCDQF